MMMVQSQQWLKDNALRILDTMVDAVVSIDVSGTIQSVNAAALTLFGYEAEELLGVSVSKLMPEPHRTRHDAYVSRYLSTGDPHIIGKGRELTALTRSGAVIPIHLAISEIRTHDDERYFVGIVRDLSEQKATHEALMEQRERLARIGRVTTMGEMTASIAHEINQPLTAITMYSQACIRMLDQPDLPVERIQQALTKLNAQTLRAGAIIERIQRFVRNESGDTEPVDLNAMLTELQQLTSADARLHGVEITYDLAPDLPMVMCDRVQIQQVAINFIRNAIDAMHEVACANGSEVEIGTRPLDDAVEVSVRDSGTGVSDEEKEQIFTAFHTTKSDGMGMGLSICRSIIDVHGGSLWFRNNPDHGATFGFRLPVTPYDD